MTNTELARAPRLDLTVLFENAQIYASIAASPHHITFTVEALRSLIEEYTQAAIAAAQPDQTAAVERGRELYATLLAAAQAVQAVPGWQPIETAPKDAYLLLWIDIVIGHPLVVQGCWFHDDDEDEKGWIDLDGKVLHATHWTPLPPAPGAPQPPAKQSVRDV